MDEQVRESMLHKSEIMKNDSFAKRLKQGEDISSMRRKFYVSRILDICYVSNYYDYCRCRKADYFEIVKNLSEIPDLQGRSIENSDFRGNDFIAGQEFSVGGLFKYRLFLYRMPGGYSLFYMRSILVLDDMEFFASPKESVSDGFGAKLMQIAAVLPQWNTEWRKLNTEILKLRKQIDVGSSTIESVLPVILEELGYPYYTERDAGDTLLYVKLPYHRCLSIKLKPEMDMTKLMELSENIRMIDEALKKMGNTYLKVKNYGNNIKWSK